MAISFSEASAARIEASRADGVANRMQAVQVALFAQWVQAMGADDQATMDYLSARFPEPLVEAFGAWQATDPMVDPDAPASPFAMEEYALPDRSAAEDADHRAEAAFDEAVEANERGDNYTLLTVAFAPCCSSPSCPGRWCSDVRSGCSWG